MKKFYTHLLILLCATTFLHAQKHTIGLDATGFRLTTPGAVFMPGVTYSHQFTAKSSVFGGLYLSRQTYNFSSTQVYDNNVITYAAKTRYHFLSIPVLYTYHTKLVNISLGPALTFYTGHTIKKSHPEMEVNTSVSGYPALGYLARLSRKIKIKDRLSLEPSIIAGDYQSFSSVYGGLGLGIRYGIY